MISLITVILSTTVWFVKIAFWGIRKETEATCRNQSERGRFDAAGSPACRFQFCRLPTSSKQKERKKRK